MEKSKRGVITGKMKASGPILPEDERKEKKKREVHRRRGDPTTKRKVKRSTGKSGAHVEKKSYPGGKSLLRA